MKVGDAFDGSIKCSKGEVSIYYQLRFHQIKDLEGLSDLPCIVEKSLSKPIPLSFYYNKHNALVDTKKVTGVSKIDKGQSLMVYAREPSAPTSAVSVGDVLVGHISASKDYESIRVTGKGVSTSIDAGKAPERIAVIYTVEDTKVAKSSDAGSSSGSKPKKKENKSAKNGDKIVKESLKSNAPPPLPSTMSKQTSSATGNEDNTAMDSKYSDYTKHVKDTKIKYLSKFSTQSDSVSLQMYNKVYDELQNEYPDDLSLALMHLSHSLFFKESISKKDSKRMAAKNDNEEASDQEDKNHGMISSACADMITAADNVLRLIDSDVVAITLGQRAPDNDDKDGCERVREMEKQKEALIDALKVKYLAFNTKRALLISNKDDNTESDILQNELDTILIEWKKWEDLHCDKNWYFTYIQNEMKEEYGNALKCIDNVLTKIEKGEKINLSSTLSGVTGWVGAPTRSNLWTCLENTLSKMGWTFYEERASKWNRTRGTEHIFDK